MRVRTPCPECGSHQCCTSPSTNWRAGRAQQMRARHRRAGGRQRHAVLQLVAEPVGAARLVERRARPDPAGQGLVEQPAVQHDVHRAVRRLHLHRAQDVVPGVADRRQHGVEIGRAVARIRRRAASAPSAAPRQQTISTLPPAGSSSRRAQRAARIEAGPDRVRQRFRAGQRRRAGERSVAAEELLPIAGPARLPAAEIERRRRARRSRRLQGLRANIAPVTGSISVVTYGADAVRDGPSTHSTYAVTDRRRAAAGNVAQTSAARS